MKWQPTFTTPLLRSQDWVLSIMILGAIFIHGIAFYLVQVSAPESGKKNTPSARLSLLDPNNPRDQATLLWVENHDPAAIAYQPESPQPAHLLQGESYQPSYKKVLPEPLPILLEDGQILHQTFFPPGPVAEVKTQNPAANNPAFTALPSKIILSPSLDFAQSPPFTPPQITGEIPRPSKFLIVNSGTEGEKSFFLIQASGNDALDAYARSWLATAPLSLKNNASSGWAEIHWGGEIWEKNTP